MNNRAARYVTYGQIGFFIFIGMCVALKPEFLFTRNQGGLSNYGTYNLTRLPFTLAFLSTSFFMLRAAGYIDTKAKLSIQMKRLLQSFALLSFLLLASTYAYRLSPNLKDIHISLGFAFYFFELAAVVWLAVKFSMDRFNIGLLVIQALSFVVGILTYMHIVTVLFSIQLATSLTFSILLVRCMNQQLTK